MKSKDAKYSRERFDELVSNMLREVDLLDKWIASESHDSNTDNSEPQDSVLNFHKGFYV